MLKTFNYNKNGASKMLEVFLNKRKSTQRILHILFITEII